jgi:hypothetical protein
VDHARKLDARLTLLYSTQHQLSSSSKAKGIYGQASDPLCSLHFSRRYHHLSSSLPLSLLLHFPYPSSSAAPHDVRRKKTCAGVVQDDAAGQTTTLGCEPGWNFHGGICCEQLCSKWSPYTSCTPSNIRCIRALQSCGADSFDRSPVRAGSRHQLWSLRVSSSCSVVAIPSIRIRLTSAFCRSLCGSFCREI